MNRRTLFTRLSALAVAPLAKWLPGEEFPWCEATGLYMTEAQTCPDFYVIGMDVGRDGYTTTCTFESRNGVLALIDERRNLKMPDDRNGAWRFKPFSGEPIADWNPPIPQEES